MLTLQTDLINRIQSQVAGFKTVGNPSVVAGLRDIGQLLPACLVAPGAGRPIEQRQPELPTIEEQEWVIAIVVAHQHTDAADGLTEQIAGGFMQEIVKALHGWKADAAPQKQGFIYTGRDRPAYSMGYAEFPMAFISKFIVGTTY